MRVLLEPPIATIWAARPLLSFRRGEHGNVARRLASQHHACVRASPGIPQKSAAAPSRQVPASAPICAAWRRRRRKHAHSETVLVADAVVAAPRPESYKTRRSRRTSNQSGGDRRHAGARSPIHPVYGASNGSRRQAAPAIQHSSAAASGCRFVIARTATNAARSKRQRSASAEVFSASGKHRAGKQDDRERAIFQHMTAGCALS